jgi:hypothetical protein
MLEIPFLANSSSAIFSCNVRSLAELKRKAPPTAREGPEEDCQRRRGRLAQTRYANQHQMSANLRLNWSEH